MDVSGPPEWTHRINDLLRKKDDFLNLRNRAKPAAVILIGNGGLSTAASIESQLLALPFPNRIRADLHFEPWSLCNVERVGSVLGAGLQCCLPHFLRLFLRPQKERLVLTSSPAFGGSLAVLLCAEMFCSILFCTVLCQTVLCYPVLCYPVLCYSDPVLCYNVLCCTVLCYCVMSCAILPCATLPCATLSR